MHKSPLNCTYLRPTKELKPGLISLIHNYWFILIVYLFNENNEAIPKQ